MENKLLNLSNVKQMIGWAYPDFKWLTKKEGVRVNRERGQLLKALSGKVHFCWRDSKIYTGTLSPGCIICGEGTWSCMYINGLCTAHCFFCPQDRKMKKERLPSIENGIIFTKPRDYVNFLEKFGFKGVGFSGGEPSLIFEKLLAFIRQIRLRFKDKMYLWIYTNGDLITPDKVRLLKKTGLNEIRFNISSGGYGLHCLELALGSIDNVTVEIPVIPEDFEIVKKSLSRMRDMGVKYLNLHQLNTTNFNYKNYINRNYTFLHQPLVSIVESELTALKLFQYALDKKIMLSLNYCSSSYKHRFQSKGARMRAAPFVRENFEEVTPAGYIRSFSLQESPQNLKRFISFFKGKTSLRNLWDFNDTQPEVFFHHSLLTSLNVNSPRFIIRYFKPHIIDSTNPSDGDKEIILNSFRKLYVRKESIFEQKGVSLCAIKCILKLYIEHVELKDMVSYFYQNYPLTTKENVETMKKEMELIIFLKQWEELEVGFPEMY